MFSIGDMIGASFVGTIVTMKEVVSISSLSETITVISESPLKSGDVTSRVALELFDVVVTPSESEKDVKLKISFSSTSEKSRSTDSKLFSSNVVFGG